MKVRANSVYTFQRCSMDTILSQHCAGVVDGQQVRVVNLYGAPKCNMMGMANIETLGGELIGMCSTASLYPKQQAGA